MAFPTNTIVNAAGTAVRVDGGSIVYGNSTRNGINSLGYTDSSIGSKRYTHGVKEDLAGQAASGVVRANTGHAIATQVAGDYVIPFVSNTKLGTPVVGNAGNRKSVNYNFNVRTSRVITAGWNLFTGNYLGQPVEAHDDFVHPDLDGTNDRPIDTRPVPGKLAFVKTGKDVTQDTYDPKTG